MAVDNGIAQSSLLSQSILSRVLLLLLISGPFISTNKLSSRKKEQQNKKFEFTPTSDKRSFKVVSIIIGYRQSSKTAILLGTRFESRLGVQYCWIKIRNNFTLFLYSLLYCIWVDITVYAVFNSWIFSLATIWLALSVIWNSIPMHQLVFK